MAFDSNLRDHMQISHCCLYAVMAKKRLDSLSSIAILCKMRCKTMPQSMRMDVFINACFFCSLLYNNLHCPDADVAFGAFKNEIFNILFVNIILQLGFDFVCQNKHPILIAL